MSNDVIVDEVRRVRHELVKRYGGLDGWIQHLQAMDREGAAGHTRAPRSSDAPRSVLADQDRHYDFRAGPGSPDLGLWPDRRSPRAAADERPRVEAAARTGKPRRARAGDFTWHSLSSTARG